MLGLRCCSGFLHIVVSGNLSLVVVSGGSSLVVGSRNCSLVAACRLLVAGACLVAEPRLRAQTGAVVGGSGDCSLVAACSLLVAGACLAAEPRLRAQTGAVVGVQGLAAPWCIGSSRSRDRTCVSCSGSRFFTTKSAGKTLLVHFLMQGIVDTVMSCFFKQNIKLHIFLLLKYMYLRTSLVV